jgi:hypothetical protein
MHIVGGSTCLSNVERLRIFCCQRRLFSFNLQAHRYNACMSNSMNRNNRFLLFLILLFAGTTTIIVLSLIRVPGGVALFSGQDKVGHFLAYMVLSWLAARAFACFPLRRLPVLASAFLYAGTTGALLEFLQPLLTSSRQAEGLDMVANLTGALVGCVLFCLVPGFSCVHDHDHPPS